MNPNNPKTRNALIAVLALSAVSAGFIAANHMNRQQSVTPGNTLNETPGATGRLLALTLPDAGATNQPLRQWQGKLLVVNFWATWCPPCREEMPGFSRLNTKFASKGVRFVGIAIDNADKVQEYSIQTPTSYPLLVGSPALMNTMAGLGNTAGGLPFTVIIGRDGTLLQTRLGLWRESVLEATLTDLANGS